MANFSVLTTESAESLCDLNRYDDTQEPAFHDHGVASEVPVSQDRTAP